LRNKTNEAVKGSGLVCVLPRSGGGDQIEKGTMKEHVGDDLRK